jgi:hypothetical protein
VTTTRTRRDLTPVDITEKHPAIRTGKVQAWAAESDDGTWAYRRLELPGTPWEVEHLPTGTDCGWFSSLPKARAATADGSALEAVEQAAPSKLDALRRECAAAGITADSPDVLDREAEDLYRLEKENWAMDVETVRCVWCETTLAAEEAEPIKYARLRDAPDEDNMECKDHAACDRRQDALDAAIIVRSRAAGSGWSLMIKITPGVRAALSDGERLREAMAILDAQS